MAQFKNPEARTSARLTLLEYCLSDNGQTLPLMVLSFRTTARLSLLWYCPLEQQPCSTSHGVVLQNNGQTLPLRVLSFRTTARLFILWYCPSEQRPDTPSYGVVLQNNGHALPLMPLSCRIRILSRLNTRKIGAMLSAFIVLHCPPT